MTNCIFFNDKMKNMPSTAEQFKKRFCKGDNGDCARYMVFKAAGRERVPQDLFPNQHDKVGAVMAAT